MARCAEALPDDLVRDGTARPAAPEHFAGDPDDPEGGPAAPDAPLQVGFRGRAGLARDASSAERTGSDRWAAERIVVAGSAPYGSGIHDFPVVAVQVRDARSGRAGSVEADLFPDDCSGQGDWPEVDSSPDDYWGQAARAQGDWAVQTGDDRFAPAAQMDGSGDSFPDGYSAEAAREQVDWAEVDSSAADCWGRAGQDDWRLAQRVAVAQWVALPGVRLLQEECRDGSWAVVFLDSLLESAWRVCREGPA